MTNTNHQQYSQGNDPQPRLIYIYYEILLEDFLSQVQNLNQLIADPSQCNSTSGQNHPI